MPRCYLWLTKMAWREGGAWLKVLGNLVRGQRRRPYPRDEAAISIGSEDFLKLPPF